MKKKKEIDIIKYQYIWRSLKKKKKTFTNSDSLTFPISHNLKIISNKGSFSTAISHNIIIKYNKIVIPAYPLIILSPCYVREIDLIAHWGIICYLLYTLQKNMFLNPENIKYIFFILYNYIL